MTCWLVVWEESGLPVFLEDGDEVRVHADEGLAIFISEAAAKQWIREWVPGRKVRVRKVRVSF